MGRFQIAQQLPLKGVHPFQRHLVGQAGIHRKEDHHFLLQPQRLVLRLFQHFGGQLPPGQLRPGRRVQIGSAELGKGGQFPILSQVQPQPAGYLADGPGLRRPADPGHRQAHIHRRPDADIEQFRLQVNLPVGDGNYISGNVGGHIPGLGFNDGQGGNGAAAVFGVQPRRPFQQTAVQIENIPRISLPAGRPAQQ